MLKRSTDPDVPHQLSFKDQCTILYQISCALNFISGKSLVHRDIAARNCLVGTGIQAKLADFGLARGTGSDLYYRKLGGAVPIRWMSPEAIFDGKYSVRSDIWSFGVLVWEVFTFGQLPFYGWSNEEVLEKVRDGWHLALPENCPVTVCEIMEWCWEQDPHERVAAEQLVLMYSCLMRQSVQTANVPLCSLAEFESVVPSRDRLENEYVAGEELIAETFEQSHRRESKRVKEPGLVKKENPIEPIPEAETASNSEAYKPNHRVVSNNNSDTVVQCASNGNQKQDRPTSSPHSTEVAEDTAAAVAVMNTAHKFPIKYTHNGFSPFMDSQL